MPRWLWREFEQAVRATNKKRKRAKLRPVSFTGALVALIGKADLRVDVQTGRALTAHHAHRTRIPEARRRTFAVPQAVRDKVFWSAEYEACFQEAVPRYLLYSLHGRMAEVLEEALKEP